VNSRNRAIVKILSFLFLLPVSLWASSDQLVEIEKLCSSMENAKEMHEKEGIAQSIVELMTEYKPEDSEKEDAKKKLHKCIVEIGVLGHGEMQAAPGEFIVQNLTGRVVNLALFHCKSERTISWNMQSTVCSREMLNSYPHKVFSSLENVKEAGELDKEPGIQEHEIISVSNFRKSKFNILHPKFHGDWMYVTAYNPKEICKQDKSPGEHGFKGTPNYVGHWGQVFQFDHPGWLKMGSSDRRLQRFLTITAIDTDPCSFNLILH